MPSFNIRKQSHLGCSDWITQSDKVERFINLTLRLINPGLFESGLRILQKLRKLETTRDIASQWQSVYTGISVISNRTTPAHRDTKGKPEWFDTLTSYADPSARPRLLIKDVGLDLEYNSGTVVAFCGSIFEHEVESWGDGDRVCSARFMREAVMERMNVAPAGWVNRSIYLPEDDAMDVD